MSNMINYRGNQVAGFGETCPPGGTTLTEEQRIVIRDCIEASPIAPIEPDRGIKSDIRKYICWMDGDVRSKVGPTAGSQTFRDHVLFSRRLAGALQRVEFFQDNDARTPGVTNVNRARLPEGTNFVVSGIQLLSGVNANPNDILFGELRSEDTNEIPGTAKVITTGYGLPAEIRQGWLIFEYDGVRLLEDLPVSYFIRPQDTSHGLVNYLPLNFPILLLADRKFNVILETPAAIPTNTYVLLNLVGGINRVQHLNPKA
jgi:hypothetical protein